MQTFRRYVPQPHSQPQPQSQSRPLAPARSQPRRPSRRLAGRQLLLPQTLLLLAVGPLCAQQAAEPVLSSETAAAIGREGLERSRVMATLTDLTSRGHRLTGSDHFTRACAWAQAQMQAIGLQDVHQEPFATWKLVWDYGHWRGRIVAPIELDMYVATDAWTFGTRGPLRARVLRAPKDAAEAGAAGEALRGALLFTGGKRAGGPLRAACERLGIAGWLYDAYGDGKYPDRVRVFGHHQRALGRLEDVPTTPEVAIQHGHAQRLAALLDAEGGAEVVVELDLANEFREGPIALHNVIGEIRGSTRPDEVVIVCGHLDSWHQAQGCTDNGTGVATTLEAARILTAIGARPQRTIRFILWGGEEQGLLGSVAYVRQHRQQMDKVACVFNHDTGTNWAQSLTVSDAMYAPMQRVFAPVLQLPSPDPDFAGPVFDLRRRPQLRLGIGASDHAAFFAARVPGFDWGLSGRADYIGRTWHSQWDTIDAAIPEYQRHTSTVVALAALGVADLPQLLDHQSVQPGGGGTQAGTFAQSMFGAEMDGLQFTAVEAGGRAARLGIQPGDVLLRINGKPVERVFELFTILRDEQPDELVFALERATAAGKQLVEARLPASAIVGTPFDAELDGMRFTRLEAGGRGERLGIEVDDVLLEIDGKPVARLRELRALLPEGGDAAHVLTLRRGEQVLQIRASAAQLRPPAATPEGTPRGG